MKTESSAVKIVIVEASSAADRAQNDEFRAKWADAGDRQLYGVEKDLDWEAERYVLVARDGNTQGMGAILGSATSWHIGGVAKVTDLLVAEAARRKGVARSLVVELERRARLARCHRMHAVTAAGSVAERFWRAMGWSETARLADYYFGREHIVLTRSLRGRGT